MKQTLIEQAIEKLQQIKTDPSTWEAAGAGGQDSFAGLPPAVRTLDSVIQMLQTSMRTDPVIVEVERRLHDICRVEGRPVKVTKFGNSLAIRFQFGTTYLQPFIHKSTGEVTLDNHDAGRKENNL